MEIVVDRINVDTDEETAKRRVTVRFSRQVNEGEGLADEAHVTVWIPVRDAPLSELREDAIQAAVAGVPEKHASAAYRNKPKKKRRQRLLL
jgi:hypothetical protein